MIVDNRILVIGGTGVSGVHLVNGLLEREKDVTIFHSGTHKPAKDFAPWYYDGRVKIVYGNAFKKKGIEEALGDLGYFDVVCSMYGNLRSISRFFSSGSRLGRFISIGGAPLYDMWGNANHEQAVDGWSVSNLITESFRIQTDDGTLNGKPISHNPKLDQMILAEKEVFRDHPTATHLRYPLMYGPYQLIPDEYMVVKRCLDKRPFMIISQFLSRAPRSVCYGKNGAEFVLKAIDNPKASKGEIFLVGDCDHPTNGQWIKLIANALGHDLEIIEVPDELQAASRPLAKEDVTRLNAYMMSNEKAQTLLGYKDPVPAIDAITSTARWLAKNPPSHKLMKTMLQDPFEYETEDLIAEAYRKGDLNAALQVKWKNEPGYGYFYYGNNQNPADSRSQAEKHSGDYDPTKVRRIKAGPKSSKL